MKPLALNILRTVVSLSLLVVLLFYIDIQKIQTYTPDVISAPLLVALIAALGQIVLTSWRWHYLLKAVNVVLPLRLIIRTNVVGIIANIVLLNVIGGVVARAGMLVQKGVEIHSVLSTSVLERVVIVFVLCMMSVGGLVYLNLGIRVHSNIAFRVIAGIGLLIAIALLVVNYTAPILGARVLWLKMQLISTWLEIRAQALNGRAIAVTFALTVVSQILLVVVGMAVAYSTDPTISLLQCALILPLVALISSLPISIGGLGLREASAVVLFGTLGISSEQALMISVLISIITLIVACLSFALDMLYEFTLKFLRRRGAEKNS